MPRFIVYQKLVLILTLAAALSLGSLAPRPSFAAPSDGQGKGPGDGGGDGRGDPDVPTGTTQKVSTTGLRAGVQPMVQKQGGTPAVGDGSVAQTVWMWRLRIVLQGLRIITFHF